MDTTHIPTGFIRIDKPVDWTSHDIVGYLRKITGIRKIGHAGTLDPFASGLLLVGIGRQATKRLDEFKGMRKEYLTTIQFGKMSSTGDCTGEIADVSGPKMTKETLEAILPTFLGEIQQIPPMYSAKKVGGKKLYELARKGIEIERQPECIEIFAIEIVQVDEAAQTAELRIACGAGTYIRTLAEDIAKALGSNAYCKTLRRTKIGGYWVEDAKTPEMVNSNSWHEYIIWPDGPPGTPKQPL